MRAKELLAGLLGTVLSSAGAMADVNEVLTIVSTIITILGGIMTLIVIPLVTWYKRAKEDGKITKEELQEGIDIVKDGVEELKDKQDKEKK